MIWNLIGSIGGNFLDIVDDLVEDKDGANRKSKSYSSKTSPTSWKQHYNKPLGKGTVKKYVYKVDQILKAT